MAYKTTCPTCNKHNYYCSEVMCYCFNCGYWQSINGVIAEKKRANNIKDIRALYTIVADYYHSNLQKEHEHYLYNRGFTREDIKKLKIGYCPIGKSNYYVSATAKDAGLANKDHTAFLGGRLIFPYFNKSGYVTDLRGRAFGSSDQKYLSPYHSAYYRGADYPYNFKDAVKEQNKTIIITEGEIKAAISTKYGFPAIALPGMLTWRIGYTPKEDINHIIVLDNQRDQRKQIQKAITRLSKKLENVRVATLPLYGENKQDIDSFINSYGIDEYALVIDNAVMYDEWLEYQ